MVTLTTLPAHETCNHWRFGLTCTQYEAMLRESGERCVTCGVRASDLWYRKLVIDHDRSVGDWAVRGLICQKCNAALRYDRADPEWARDYLARPWYKQMLAKKGLTADPPEPAARRVLDFYDRIWFRRHDLWSTGHKKCAHIPWHGLLRKYGPHNLTPLASGPVLVRGGRVID